MVIAAFDWKDPCRARIRARLERRRGSFRYRRESWKALQSFNEAHALMWDGQLERAIRVLDAHVLGRKKIARVDASAPILIKLEAMLLDGQIDPARELFDEVAATVHGDDVAFIRALFDFHEDRLDVAREALEGIVARARRIDPMPYAARFFLAAIAHRQGRSDDAFALLTEVIRRGEDLVVARWAREQCEALFADRKLPDSLSQPVADQEKKRKARRLYLARNLRRHLKAGLALLVFYTAPLRAIASIRVEHVAVLVLFNLLVAVGLHAGDYSRTAHFSGWPILLIVAAPIALVLITSVVATFGRRPDRTGEETATRLVVALYAVLPWFFVLGSIAAHLQSPVVTRIVEIAGGVWALLVVVRATQAVLRDRLRSLSHLARLAFVAIAFAGTFLLPVHTTLATRLWFELPPSVTAADNDDDDDDELVDTNLASAARDRQREVRQDHDLLVIEQAERLIATERALEPGRPAFTDLYFIGAAGWSEQDVFMREVTSARDLMDARFDTKGRSLILANDPLGRALEHPLSSVVNLRHAIDGVGKRMDRDEDILFLFITSHGDAKGLGFQFAHNAAYDAETLKPTALKSMLDDAGIKWRVLVISGCESGVFLEPLRSPTTLLVTAAAMDRPSYGCETGNAYTEFGRALFGEVLPQERSFPTAFRTAITKVEAREKKEGLLPSRPQFAEGAEIAAKLHQFEGAHLGR